MTSFGRIIFVGSFKKSGLDGSVGGQMYACTTLVESDMSNYVDWILLDSTANSNLRISFIKRLTKALVRLMNFARYLIFFKVDQVLIFTADGFSFLEKGSMAILAKMFSKRVVIAPRSGVIKRDLEESSFMRFFISLTFKYVDVIVCQGESWKKLFGEIVIDESKLVVLQNWIDVDKYYPKPFDFDSKVVNVLFMSWVIKDKGIFDLIHAASRIRNLNLNFQIAGNGVDLEESKKLARELGVDEQFEFMGWVVGERKTRLLKGADIYVLPSYFEGFPNSLMEAMASEIAVISTKVGSVPDLVEHESDGLLIDIGDQLELGNALTRLEGDAGFRRKIANNARNKILNNNNMNKAVIAFYDILDK